MGRSAKASPLGTCEAAKPADRFALLDRIASLETRLHNARTQSSQIERLRKFGSWEMDIATGAVSWSEGAYRIFGVPLGEPITAERAMAFYPAEAQTAINEGFRDAAASGSACDVTVPFTDANGRQGWVRALGQLESASGVERVVGVIEDVTHDKATQDQLHELVFVDALTGLSNRRAFEARLAAAAGGAALLLLDIDNFKSINDTFGHPCGDALLRIVAERLRRCVRPVDLIARLGGDEFAVLFAGVDDPAVLKRKAAQILDAVRETVDTEAAPLRVTASIGTAHAASTASCGGLFKCADIALYRAKALGRNQAQGFRREFTRRANQETRTLDSIRRALLKNRMVVFYQPIIDLRSSLLRGLEALVRWNHPTRGILPPAAFSAALDDPTLSAAIDDFVLERSLQQMRDWLDAGVPAVTVNVNASEAQLRRPDLVARVRRLLADYRLTPDRLKVELVETAFISRDTKQIARTIHELAELGVVCALDDFGTGYASLTHLRQFRVERIKIDRSFIANICNDPFDRGLTKSLIDLGRNLGIRMTAEGVETEEQLALLRDYGCDCAQGYLFGRPAPAADVPGIALRWYGGQGAAGRVDAGAALRQPPPGRIAS